MGRYRLLLALTLTFLAMQSMAQNPGLTLTVDVPLVSVDAVVRDSGGEVMTSLKQSDFAIYEKASQCVSRETVTRCPNRL